MTYNNFDMRERKREREREGGGGERERERDRREKRERERGRERRERERSMTLKSRTVTHGLEISPCFGMYIDTLILHRVGQWGQLEQSGKVFSNEAETSE